MNKFDTLDSLIGIPYIDKGRDPNIGLDCYGLVIWVCNSILKLNIDGEDSSTWLTKVRKLDWPKEELERYDFILYSSDLIYSDIVNHVGVVRDPVNVIHASGAHKSVVCERILPTENFIRGIYRLKNEISI